MKTKLLLPVLALCCFFASCFDLTETVSVKNDGSGTYEQNLDFTQSMGMLSGMMADETSGDSSKKKEKIDTSFSLANIVDTVSGLTPQQKQVMGKALIKIHVDEAKNEFVLNMKYPFANSDEFNLLQTTLSSDTTFSILKSFNQSMAATGGQPKLPLQQYRYHMTPSSITREVIAGAEQNANPEVSDEMKQLQAMGDMFTMHFNTIINLPKAAKSWKGDGIFASDDKKTIKLSKDVKLSDKSNPSMAFSVQY